MSELSAFKEFLENAEAKKIYVYSLTPIALTTALMEWRYVLFNVHDTACEIL